MQEKRYLSEKKKKDGSLFLLHRKNLEKPVFRWIVYLMFSTSIHQNRQDRIPQTKKTAMTKDDLVIHPIQNTNIPLFHIRKWDISV